MNTTIGETVEYTQEAPSQDNANSILVVRGLKKYFPISDGGVLGRVTGYVKAVDDITFELNKGETLGIVGESGCGKSTMGRTIIRLLEPTEGVVLFNGKSIKKMNNEQMRQVRREAQFIFQDPYASLNPRMTIGSILEEPLVVHGIGDKKSRKQAVMDILKEVGLDEHHYYYYPHEFSGGQRQRIAIARALIINPKLIIADECVSALDVSIQAQVLNLMQELQKRYDLTYIFISHDLSVVKYISTRIGVLYLGKMMELANTEELYDNPMHPYTQSLLASAPNLKNRHHKNELILESDIPSASNPPSGCVFHTRCSKCMEICKTKVPFLSDVGNGHMVACHQFKPIWEK